MLSFKKLWLNDEFNVDNSTARVLKRSTVNGQRSNGHKNRQHLIIFMVYNTFIYNNFLFAY